jgi:hypothetical protein
MGIYARFRSSPSKSPIGDIQLQTFAVIVVIEVDVFQDVGMFFAVRQIAKCDPKFIAVYDDEVGRPVVAGNQPV